MSGSYEPVDAVVVAATAKAVLIRTKKSQDQFWVPKSVCEDGEDLAVGDDDVRIQRWFVEQNL